MVSPMILAVRGFEYLGVRPLINAPALESLLCFSEGVLQCLPDATAATHLLQRRPHLFELIPQRRITVAISWDREG